MNSNQNPSGPTSIGNLLGRSGLSNMSQTIIIDNLNGNTSGIMGTTGVGVDQLNEDDVTLLSVLIDASGSMQAYQADVVAAYNDALQALRDSKLDDSIIMSLWTFSDTVSLVHNWTPLGSCQPLTMAQYQPNGSTALYDGVLDAMGGMVPYATNLRNNGMTVRGILLGISDGENNNSRNPLTKVQQLAADMLNQEIYTLAFYAFGSEGLPEARRMGFPSVFQTGNSQSELRRGFNAVSKSVIRASKTQVTTSGSSFFNP